MHNEKRLCLKNKNGWILFHFNNEDEIKKFLVECPKYMRKENHERIVELYNNGDLFMDFYEVMKPYVPDPMPESRKNNFGAYIED